jgi:hypothetical protein
LEVTVGCGVSLDFAVRLDAGVGLGYHQRKLGVWKKG